MTTVSRVIVKMSVSNRLLTGGNGVNSGNVFTVNRNGYYGPVCDDYWDDTDATIVCR